jgi:hypothetical protein
LSADKYRWEAARDIKHAQNHHWLPCASREAFAMRIPASPHSKPFLAQSLGAISHFDIKNRPILGAVSHFGQQAGAKPLAWTLHNVEVQKFGRKF